MIQITYKICIIPCSIHNYTLTSKCLCPFCNTFVTTGMKPKHIRSVLFENSPGFQVFISRNYDVGQSKLYTLWSFASKARIPCRQRNQLTTSRCKLQTLLNCWRDFFIMSFYPPLDHAGHGSVLDGVLPGLVPKDNIIHGPHVRPGHVRHRLRTDDDLLRRHRRLRLATVLLARRHHTGVSTTARFRYNKDQFLIRILIPII